MQEALSIGAALTCWFASTLRASWHTPHEADVSPSFHDYEICSRWGNSENGTLSCMAEAQSFRADYVQSERAIAQFNTLIGACNAERARSK